MPLETPARPHTHPGHPLAGWQRRLRVLRAVLPYVLIAAALLAISEMLWLWHSWPVRHVLDSEQLIAGAKL
jgi:hypothetical protein